MSRDRFAIIAHTLVLNANGEALLLRRANTGLMDGRYALPGGHRQAGESVRACAIRECREEAGIVVEAVTPTMVLPYGDGVNFIFTADRWHGEPVIGEPDKCDDLLFAPLHELPSATVAWVDRVVSGAATGVWYAEFD